jgi:hypothetical protein
MTDLCDSTMISYLRSSFPLEAPLNLHLHPVPDDIVSWLSSIWQTKTHILHSSNEDAWEKADRAWRRWLEFLPSIGITDAPLLLGLDTPQRSTISTAFAQSLRQGDFKRSHTTGTNNTTTLCAGTVRASVGRVATEFRRHGHPSPFHQQIQTNLFSDSILGLMRAWMNLDPPSRQQEAINPKHLVFLNELAISSGNKFLRC